MKIIFMNLLSIMRRFKLAWAMNFLGISAALAALMFVAMQIVYEDGFDRCQKNVDRIYLIAEDISEKPFDIILDRYNIEQFGTCSPKIEAYSSVLDMIQDYYVEVTGSDGNRHGFYEHVMGVDSGFVKMFDFDIIVGDPNRLAVPGNAMISESTAKKIFGTTDVVGRNIGVNENWCMGDSVLTVTAVYRDFPSNTQINNAIYFALDETAKDGNSGRNFMAWVMLSSPDDKAEVEQMMNSCTHLRRYIMENNAQYRLEPMSQTYYGNEGDVGFVKSGSRSTTAMLAAIAIVVLLIAAVNHTNFSIALIPLRIRNVNTQKVLGSSVGRLRCQLFAENVIVGVATWAVALIMVALLNGTWITSFLIPKDLSISGNIGICMAALLVALIINVLAGIYPVVKLTSANPSLVLKGSYGRSMAGNRLRTVLLVFQFFAAMCFISIAVCIWLQIRHMGNANPILNNSQVAVFKTNQHFGSKCDVLIDRLKENSAIEAVAFTANKIGETDVYNTNSLSWQPKNKDAMSQDVFSFHNIFCTAEFLDVFGISLTEGDGFGDRADSDVSFNNVREDCVISPSMAAYGIQVGDTVFGAVKGICEDVRILSFRAENMPLMFTISRARWLNYCNVRIAKGANIRNAVAHIEQVAAEIAPEMPLEIEFCDKVFQQQYEKEISTSATTVFMAVLAILISIIGVFGMVMFDIEYKRQEVAVRRVFGASVKDILQNINLKYLIMVFSGFVLSLPLSLYVILNWQQSFVEKAPMPWWIFALIFAAVAVVTALIVTVQSAKAVYQNPSDGLRRE